MNIFIDKNVSHPFQASLWFDLQLHVDKICIDVQEGQMSHLWLLKKSGAWSQWKISPSEEKKWVEAGDGLNILNLLASVASMASTS